MSDYYNIIDSAEKRAREEGRAEGLAEGRDETIAKLVAAGFDREQIEAALEDCEM